MPLSLSGTDALFGSSGRDRTYDKRINSPLLLPLSYAGIFLAPVDRIELPLTVLETAALPLYYTGILFYYSVNKTKSQYKLVLGPGVEPGPGGYLPKPLIRRPALPRAARVWWRLPDSNRSPSACKADALPDELNPLIGDPDGIRTRDLRRDRPAH